MSNEQKVCCGGFFIGDGLEMDGKTLKALGGGDTAPVHVVSLIKNGSDYTLEEGVNSLKIQEWIDNKEEVIIEDHQLGKNRYYRFGYSSGGSYPSFSFYEILKTATDKLGIQWLDIGWIGTGDIITISNNEFTPD